MLDPDRHANRWRSDSDFTTSLFREPGMHCRRGMANQGFRSAQTDRQFEYLKAIEESERVRLISFDVEGESPSLLLKAGVEFTIGRRKQGFTTTIRSRSQNRSQCRS